MAACPFYRGNSADTNQSIFKSRENMYTRTVAMTVLALGIGLWAQEGRAGWFDTLEQVSGVLGGVVAPMVQPQSPANSQPVMATHGVPSHHRIDAIPMNGQPGLPRQVDSWSCGPHVATRIARFHGKNLDYAQLQQMRIALGIPTMRRLVAVNPSAMFVLNATEQVVGQENLVHFFRTSGEEEKMFLEKMFNRAFLRENATLDELKGIVSRNIPVGVLIKNGQREEPLLNKVMKKPVKLNSYHWIMVNGYDDNARQIHYADSYEDGQRTTSYESFIDLWNTREEGFFLNVGTQMFIRERTMVWVEN